MDNSSQFVDGCEKWSGKECGSRITPELSNFPSFALNVLYIN